MNNITFISEIKLLAKQINWSLRGSLPVSTLERLLIKITAMERTTIQIEEDEIKLSTFLNNWPSADSEKIKVTKDLVAHFENKYKLFDSKNFSRFLGLGMGLGVVFGIIYHKIGLGIAFGPAIAVLLNMLDNKKKDQTKLY